MSADSTAPVVVYKDVPGFPGYRVGDDGSVWTCKRPGPGGVLRDEWRRLYPRTKTNGYVEIGLYRNKRHHHRFVHRLVLEAFVGPCPPGHECAHDPDPSPKNCRLDNLSWKTKKANHADKKTHGTQRVGEMVYCAKMTEAKVLELRARQGTATCDQLAAEYGINRTTVSDIHRRKTWKHI